MNREPRRAYGQCLREQRLARGWTAPEMGRRLRSAAKQAGDKLPDHASLLTMIYRWEDDRSGISERYRLSYCRALGILVSEFGNPAVSPPPQPPEPSADAALMLAEAAVMLLAAAAAFSRTGQARWVLPEWIDGHRASELAGRMRAARSELNGHLGP